MGNIDSRIVAAITACGCLIGILASAPAIAGDGTIVLQRVVQPRVATRPTMVPDPNPVTVNPNISGQVVQMTGSAEVSDSEFARVTSGSSIQRLIVPNGGLMGMENTTNRTVSNMGMVSGARSADGTSGVSGQVGHAVQTGLAPLQILTGGR